MSAANNNFFIFIPNFIFFSNFFNVKKGEIVFPPTKKSTNPVCTLPSLRQHYVGNQMCIFEKRRYLLIAESGYAASDACH